MQEFHKNAKYYSAPERLTNEVALEMAEGLKIINSIENPIVAVFGSHITAPGTPEYDHCKSVAKMLGEKGYGIISGGGPGIMHAANTGATEAGVPSVGLRMSSLKNEKVEDSPYTHTVDFQFMFVRRFILHIKSRALLFYPGGFGTLNELFEFIVLIQTGMTDEVPMILVNREFWTGMLDWVKETMLQRGLLAHDDKDIELLHFADTPEEIIELIEG